MMDYKELTGITRSLKRRDKNGMSRLDVLVQMCQNLKETMEYTGDEPYKDTFGGRDEYLRCQKALFAEKVLSLIFGNS